MLKNYLLSILPLSLLCITTFTSCERVFEEDNYVAYFGGEIINPQGREILFLKNGKVIDTIYLDEKNRFLHKFDSLAPGLYTFQHLPEYQYIFFDKNDSLMIRLNSHDFDNSLAFCGRGDEKNNFLIDQFLKNETELSNLYELFESNPSSFSKTIDSLHKIRTADYLKRRAEIGWSEGFDSIAKAGVDYTYYYKKELYPMAHQYKTDVKVYDSLPKTFYNYRKSVDFGNPNFTNFTPFVNYVTSLLNNKAFVKSNYEFDEFSLEDNIYKLNVADSLIQNQSIKNVVLYNIAYRYLLKGERFFNNQEFINRYMALSTDNEQKAEFKTIYEAVQNLKVGNNLPNVGLVDKNLKPVAVNTLTEGKETVIFFWTTHAESHIQSVHKKVAMYKEKYPNVNFVGININDSDENWQKALKENNLNHFTELKSTKFQDIKENWVITRVHRSMILNADGTIKNAFTNVFDVNFGKELE